MRMCMRVPCVCVFGEQAAAGLKADLAKLASSSAMEVEEELGNMTARRKELASKNVRARASSVPPAAKAPLDKDRISGG